MEKNDITLPDCVEKTSPNSKGDRELFSENPSEDFQTPSNNIKGAQSPNEEIPSYQVCRNSKRFSDLSEDQQSILPVSPVLTPPSVIRNKDISIPMVHTLGTIVKQNERFKSYISDTKKVKKDDSLVKTFSAFDELRMVDKDISWESSMETPAPPSINLNVFNTVERATFFPENDVKNMQPRALFSPSKNDDNDCLPLEYSSEGEDERGTSLRKLQPLCIAQPSVSDVAIMMEGGQESKALDIELLSGDVCKDIGIMSPHSPVFRVINKKKCKRKKLKPSLVKSPDIAGESDRAYLSKNGDLSNKNYSTNFSEKCDAGLKNNKDCLGGVLSEQSNSIQDDSFQNLSFSGIDELCNSSAQRSNASTNNNVSCDVSKQDIQMDHNGKKNDQSADDSTFAKGKVFGKYFYDNNSRTEVLDEVFSIDEFLKSAKRFEENGSAPVNGHKKALSNTQPTVFNKLTDTFSRNELSVHGLKRLSHEFSEENSRQTVPKKKLMIFKNEEESEYLPEYVKIDNQKVEEKNKECEDASFGNNSNFNANDSQTFLSAAYAESLLVSEKGLDKGKSFPTVNEETDSKINTNILNKGTSVNRSSDSNEHCKAKSFSLFSTAFGKNISISSNALKKVSHLFEEEEENNDSESNISRNESADFTNNSSHGFKTASGTVIKVSEKSLNKVRDLFNELIYSDEPSNLDSMQDFHKNIEFTCSGQKTEISEENSFKKVRQVLNTVVHTTESFISRRGPKTPEVKLDEEKVTCNQMELTASPLGFKTASNKLVKISDESLRRAKELWKDEQQICIPPTTYKKECNKELVSITEAGQSSEKDELTEFGFYGFSTASGKNVAVSAEALEKAKKILNSDEILGEMENNGKMEDVIKEKSPSKISVSLHKTEQFNNVASPGVGLTSKIDGEDLSDNSDIIPPWLHAYATSPSVTLESTNLNPWTPVEDCRYYSTPKEQYIIKSPVLGSTDRFFNKRKKKNPGRKLVFGPSPVSENLPGVVPETNFTVPHNRSAAASKRDFSQLESDFYFPFKKQKLEKMEQSDALSGSTKNVGEEDVKEDLKKMAEARAIKLAANGKVKLVKGSHILKKKEPQISLCKAVQGAFPGKYTDDVLQSKYGVGSDVLRITVYNASEFRFTSQYFNGLTETHENINSFLVGDGCTLVLDDNRSAGVKEITDSFLSCPGVQPKLISEEWVQNHYKWIVWKLCHYERSFPQIFGGRCLTPHNVMIQLKYRYDREVDLCQRSALKKILERDESSAKRMVLCVCDVKKTVDLENVSFGTNDSVVSYLLGITDGWYSCYAQIDHAMARLIEKNKIMVGMKLITQGAELLNCDKGVSPLEASGSVHLKISTNSTRRVRWDTKLGFQKNISPLRIHLDSVLPNGGLIGRIDVVVMRIYPILFKEKNPDGTHVIRNGRQENRAAAAYQKQQEEALEKIYQELNYDVQNKTKTNEKVGPKLSISNIAKVSEPEELYEIYQTYSDPSTFQDLLTEEQKQTLIDHMRRRTENTRKDLSELVQNKIKSEKMNIRNVSQLLKVKIVDLHKPDYSNPVLFTVWHPTEEVSRIFLEGKAVALFNITPSHSRFNKSVHLNSTRLTKYGELAQKVDYPSRKLTLLNELTPDYNPPFNEVDIVGVVVHIYEASYGSKLSQTIFMADENHNYVGIVFWGTCKDLGWENVLTLNSVVACSNLQWNQRKNAYRIPSLYVNDSSVFTENPKHIHLKEEIKRLKTSLPQDIRGFVSKCKEGISVRLNENKHSNLSINTNESNSNLLVSLKPKYINGFKQKPNASSTPCKASFWDLDTSEQDPSPIQKRIEKLQMLYEEPPPLSPLLPMVNLDKFKTKFRVPFKNSLNFATK